MYIKTIVSDCDDTLLTDEMTLSPLTQEALKAAHNQGIRIILASGRAAKSLYQYKKQLGLTDPYIASNGAMIIDGQTDTPISELYLSKEQAQKCARFFEDNNMYAHYYYNDRFYYNQESDFNKLYAETTKLEGKYVGELTSHISKPITKLLGIGSNEQVAMLYNKAIQELGDIASITVSKPYFLEINPLGATKGAALERLSQMIDIDPSTTIAFGDSLNDLSMLKWAKYGVAMGNARAEVKAATSLECLSNQEDGVAHMIFSHVLKEDITL